MNTKAKVALIIIVTLVIGIVLGAMLNRAFMRHRIRRAFADRNPVGMVSFIERNIRPSPEQMELIREILEKHRKKTAGMREKFMMDMRAEFESLEAELDPILTPEQKDRLKRRFRDPWRDHRRFPDRHGPRMNPLGERPPKEKVPRKSIK